MPPWSCTQAQPGKAAQLHGVSSAQHATMSSFTAERVVVGGLVVATVGAGVLEPPWATVFGGRRTRAQTLSGCDLNSADQAVPSIQMLDVGS